MKVKKTPYELSQELQALGWIAPSPKLTKADVQRHLRALKRNAKSGYRRRRPGRGSNSQLRQLIEAGQASQQKLISEVGKERYALMTKKYMHGQSRVTSMS